MQLKLIVLGDWNFIISCELAFFISFANVLIN